jgi:hypothetical protein
MDVIKNIGTLIGHLILCNYLDQFDEWVDPLVIIQSV